jgi:hemerythrin-like metal-binding protein
MTNDQDNISPEAYMLLGIPVIDKQHINLMRITNNLYMASRNSEETVNFRFIQAVHEAAEYARYHFNTEEKLMCLLDFPEFYNHKKEHEDFAWEISNFSERFQNEQDLIPRNFVHFFSDWLRFHIGASDKNFADFFFFLKNYGKLKFTLAAESLLSARSA